MSTIKRIPYREYVLSECERQWKEWQESSYGSWHTQTDATKKAYFEDMYDHLWSDRFELDEIDLPDEPECDAWEILKGEKA